MLKSKYFNKLKNSVQVLYLKLGNNINHYEDFVQREGKGGGRMVWGELGGGRGLRERKLTTFQVQNMKFESIILSTQADWWLYYSLSLLVLT